MGTEHENENYEVFSRVGEGYKKAENDWFPGDTIACVFGAIIPVCIVIGGLWTGRWVELVTVYFYMIAILAGAHVLKYQDTEFVWTYGPDKSKGRTRRCLRVSKKDCSYTGYDVHFIETRGGVKHVASEQEGPFLFQTTAVKEKRIHHHTVPIWFRGWYGPHLEMADKAKAKTIVVRILKRPMPGQTHPYFSGSEIEILGFEYNGKQIPL